MSTDSSQQHIWSHFQNQAAEYGFHASHARHAALLRKMQRLAGGGKPSVLNVGVGDGNLERTVQSLGWSASSLDPDAAAAAKLAEKGIDAKAGFVQAIPFGDRAFDFVVASEVLEHLTAEERLAALGEIRRTLKPGGYFLGTVPYQEELDLNVTVCPHCRQVFHRWGHTTSFDLPKIRAELAPSFRVVECRRTAFVEFRGRNLRGKLKSLTRLILARCGAAIAMPNILFVAQAP
ncbi:MAG TPA: class I SAM-dependent methyltransferase [Pirellulales bacterium]|jgi:SAM-dependent methyltransferase